MVTSLLLVRRVLVEILAYERPMLSQNNILTSLNGSQIILLDINPKLEGMANSGIKLSILLAGMSIAGEYICLVALCCVVEKSWGISFSIIGNF